MKRFFIMVVVVCAFPALGQAQIPLPNSLFGGCGQVRLGNDARQYGQRGLWLEYTVFTTRDINTCPISVAVEAHVPGVAGSGLSSSGLYSASVNRQIPVPYSERWESRGTHEFSVWIPLPVVLQEFKFPLPSTVDDVFIEAREEVEVDPVFQCEVVEGGEWDNGKCAYPNCPLIVDTARDGYKLTSVENGVRFDLNADGVAEQVAWTRPDSDDAFLALDRNGNGRIDDGSELFGNHTPARPDSPEITTPNGFEALKFVESSAYGVSARNGVIDARDSAFARLVLWRDLNHNGLSEPEELQPVSESGLEAIGTEYKNSKRVDKNGNEFRQRSQVLWQDGQYDQIFDVWLIWRD
jgi:hypothetical protein